MGTPRSAPGLALLPLADGPRQRRRHGHRFLLQPLQCLAGGAQLGLALAQAGNQVGDAQLAGAA